MKNKYFILVLTFLSFLVGQSSYAQDWFDDATNDFIHDFEDQGGHVDYYETYDDYANAVNHDDNPDNDVDDYGSDDDNSNHNNNHDTNETSNTGVYYWIDPGTGIRMMYDGEGRTYADMPPYNDGIFQIFEVVKYDSNWASNQSNHNSNSSNNSGNDGNGYGEVVNGGVVNAGGGGGDDTDISDGLLDPYNYHNDDPSNPYDDDQYPPGDNPNNNDPNNNDPNTAESPDTEEPPAKRVWFLDKDGDGYYSNVVYESYKPSDSYKETTNGEDCDDNDATKNLGTHCGMKKWYLDWDGDRYHSDETESEYFPGEGWILETKGVDCEETDPTITNQCWANTPSTCKGCPEAVNEVAIVDVILPDNTAQYGYVDAEGNVHIKSEDGTYKKPSQLNPNSDVDRTALHQIAASLARSVGGLNKNITINSTDGRRSAAENPAFTRTPPGTNIFLNSKGGYSTDLDNVDRFKVIIKHEILHVDDHIDGVPSNLSTHADVYIRTFESISFKEVKDDYKLSLIRSLANYILNMDKRPDTYYNPATIRAKIESFNMLHLRYSFVIPDDYKTRGKLTISIKDNYTYDNAIPYSNYEPLTDEK